ncbi:MAG: response regulator [Eubacteriales bacterium]|nr:response regulator [Eubacteriales bacterium]
MYKVLIVEDELLVREGIKKSIDWAANGFAPPKEAYNGSDAWSIIESSHVDVVITDIKMPGMNGIELIRKIRNSSKQMEIIILSCYNDFNYVKEALELGACDYLFKLDMMPEDIVKALQRAVEKLSSKESTNSKIKLLEQTISDNLHISKAAYLLDIVNGKKVTRDEFSKIADELAIKLGNNNMILAIIKIDDIDSALQKGIFDNDYTAKISILNLIISCISVNENAEVVYKSRNEYVLIINLGKISSENKRYEFSNELLRNIITSIENDYQLRVTAGTCRRFWSIENLGTAYKESSFAVDKRYFTGTGNIIYFEDLGQQKEIKDAGDEMKRMLREIGGNESEELAPSIQRIFSRIRSDDCYSINEVLEISSYIMCSLLKTVIKHDSIIEELYLSEPFIYSNLFKKSTIDDMEDHLRKIESRIDELRTARHRDEISRALIYIEHNLSNSALSLGEVAASVNLSKNYFSKVFKKSLGSNFIDFLTKARLENAEELYKTTRLKVYQIAGKVGYSDWRYFCKLYKKRKGHKLTSLKR